MLNPHVNTDINEHRPEMIGKTITHNIIQQELDHGGMGIVYNALDSRLNRTVALKVLQHYLSSSPDDRERFLREVQAASILNHPNVCTIYCIEEADGIQLIEMEFVDGITLRDMISRGNLNRPVMLTSDDVIRYAIQISEALADAHYDYGIIWIGSDAEIFYEIAAYYAFTRSTHAVLTYLQKSLGWGWSDVVLLNGNTEIVSRFLPADLDGLRQRVKSPADLLV
jgi:hypothetical protein